MVEFWGIVNSIVKLRFVFFVIFVSSYSFVNYFIGSYEAGDLKFFQHRDFVRLLLFFL